MNLDFTEMLTDIYFWRFLLLQLESFGISSMWYKISIRLYLRHLSKLSNYIQHLFHLFFLYV